MTGEPLLLAAIILAWSAFALFLAVRPGSRVFPAGFLPLALHAAWLAARAWISGHAPFSNLYESLVCFSFLLCLKGLLVARAMAGRARWAALAPGILACAAALLFPGSLAASAPLAPALRSPWLLVHVPATFWAYASLALAFGSRIRGLASKEGEGRLALSETKQALFFLGLGIVTGAFWAEACWGSFWSWDPKESWALATWLLLALLLHLRGRRALAAVTGLAVASMLFTYFGVTFLLPGLHAYLR